MKLFKKKNQPVANTDIEDTELEIEVEVENGDEIEETEIQDSQVDIGDEETISLTTEELEKFRAMMPTLEKILPKLEQIVTGEALIEIIEDDEEVEPEEAEGEDEVESEEPETEPKEVEGEEEGDEDLDDEDDEDLIIEDADKTVARDSKPADLSAFNRLPENKASIKDHEINTKRKPFSSRWDRN